MTDLNLAQLDEIINHLTLQHDIKSYHTDIKAGSSKGDNYLGKIYKLNIAGDKTINVILKTATKDPAVREKIPLEKAFEREIFMYDKVFSIFENFQKARNVQELFLPYPKFKYAVLEKNQETVVLEDLNDYNYGMWNRKNPMNHDHMCFALRTYGRFHALSIALRDQKPELFAELAENLDLVFKDTLPPDGQLTVMQLQLERIAKFFDGKNEKDVIDRLEDLKNKRDIVEFLMTKTEEFNVITHGDCWCNNMMFKYNENSSVPSEMRLLDFQFSTFGSVVFDLSYFIYACGSKDSLDNLHEYLKIYYESFSNFMEQLGSNPKKVFTFQNLIDEWNKFSVVGFLMAVTLIRLMLMDSNEAPDVETMANKDEDINVAFSKAMEISPEVYKKRIRDLVLHVVENKFI